MEDIEITDVQATQVEANWTWTFVRVYTDVGVSGTGESYWGRGVPEIIEDCKRLLVGQNPLDIKNIIYNLFDALSAKGSLAGNAVTAISGIDIALHDLVGNLTGQPAYRVLGGKFRDEARVYVDCHAGTHLGG